MRLDFIVDWVLLYSIFGIGLVTGWLAKGEWDERD